MMSGVVEMEIGNPPLAGKMIRGDFFKREAE